MISNKRAPRFSGTLIVDEYPDTSARQQARIAVAREEGYTDIFWTICHEKLWTWDWAGRPPGKNPAYPNPPVPLPCL